jgi:hypothetical protein
VNEVKLLPAHKLRLIALTAVMATVAFGVAACGGDENNNGDSEPTAQGATGNTGNTGATGSTGTTGSVPFTGATGTDQTTATLGSASESAVDSIRFFAAESPWNTTVSNLPVAANSTRLLELGLQRIGVREVPGEQGVETFARPRQPQLTINTEQWAPLVVTDGGDGAETTRMVCRQSDCGSTDPPVPEQLSLPPGTTPDPRYDGWLSVIDLEEGVGYDFWRARRQSDGTISFQFSKGWSLDGPGFSKPVSEDPVRAPGARGSGLPLFAGLISPGELTAGRIDHALAISLPGIARRNFVQPASVTNGIGESASLPAGARIRLRAGVSLRNSPFAPRRVRAPRFDARGRPDPQGKFDRDGNLLDRRILDGSATELRVRSVETILTALREYGAIVVDRADVPTLYAPRGTSRRLVRGDELDWLTIDDFEVVQLPQIYRDPPLAKVALEGPDAAAEGSVQSGQAAGNGQ